MEITGILSHAFFWKNFVKVTVLLNKLLNCSDDLTKYLFGEREFLVFPHCVMCRNFENSLSRIFGKTFVKVLRKMSYYRVDLTKYFFGESNFFSLFHTEELKLAIILWNQFIENLENMFASWFDEFFCFSKQSTSYIELNNCRVNGISYQAAFHISSYWLTPYLGNWNPIF